jgi:hypothetical protein
MIQAVKVVVGSFVATKEPRVAAASRLYRVSLTNQKASMEEDRKAFLLAHSPSRVKI